VSGDYAFGSTGPTVIGPAIAASATQQAPVLMPITHLTIIVGLEQRF
jgi:hypothetical protein